MDAYRGRRIPLQVSQGCIVASVQTDLSGEVLSRLREDILERLQGGGARAVILELSGVDVLDADDFGALRATVDMSRLLGARTVLTGLQPGVVASLIDLDVDITGLEATRTVDDAFCLLRGDA